MKMRNLIFLMLAVFTFALTSCQNTELQADTKTETTPYKTLDYSCVVDDLQSGGYIGIPYGSTWESLSFLDPSGVVEYIRGDVNGCIISYVYLQAGKEAITWADVSVEIGQTFTTAQGAIDYFDSISNLSTYTSFFEYIALGDLGPSIFLSDFYAVSQGLNFAPNSYAVNDSPNCCN